MGDFFEGFGGKKTSQRSTQFSTPGAWGLEFDSRYLNALDEALAATGGMRSIASFNPNAVPSAREMDFIGRIQGLGDRPPMTAASWAPGGTAYDLLRSISKATETNEAYSSLERMASNAWQDQLGATVRTGSALRDYAANPVISPYETAGLDTLRGRLDPTARVGAARDLLSDIIKPSITSSLTAAGQGRSGAVAEQLTRAGTELTLPILRDIDVAARDLGLAELGLGGTAEGRRLSAWGTSLGADQLATAIAGQLAGLGGGAFTRAAGLPIALDRMTTDDALARFQAGLEASSIPRLSTLREQLRGGQLATSLLMGLPLTTDQVVTGRGTTQESDTMQTLMQIASIAAAFCWVARAVFGDESLKAAWARHWIVDHAPRWVNRAYRIVGPALARVARKSRVARGLVRPVVEFFAWRGRRAWEVA